MTIQVRNASKFPVSYKVRADEIPPFWILWNYLDLYQTDGIEFVREVY